ncbi:MAG: cytochrome c [Cyclobacteriaceae bacterium]|nr:cytochrome c [Cyclobacteriaceae bacterium]
MKNPKTKSLVILLTTVLFLISMGFTVFQDSWTVPAKYKKMENPVSWDKEGELIAKQLYAKHCKSCHGKTGLGDGPKAKELDTSSGDFSVTEFHAQSDGALFYKTTFGRDDMPAYDKKISSDEDRWLLVHYMRTFKK